MCVWGGATELMSDPLLASTGFASNLMSFLLTNLCFPPGDKFFHVIFVN